MLLIVDAVDVVVVVAVVSGERGVLLASFFETGPDCHSFPELFCPVSSEHDEFALLSLLMVRW